MARKCGFHSQQVSDNLKNAIYQVLPTLCVSLAHDRDFWAEIRQNTETFLVGRLYESDLPWRTTNPREWAGECIEMDMSYHAWTTWNEPDGINNEITPADAELIDWWCCEFRAALLEAGYEAVGPNIPAGNWHGDAIVRYMPNLCQTFKHISRHEYSARAMWDQAPALERAPSEVPQNDGDTHGWWYTLTYRGWYDAIQEAYPGKGPFTIWLTETGVAYGVIPDDQGLPKYGDVGWQTDMSEADYVASLLWATERWNEDDYLGGAAIFQVGGDPDWESFETIQIWPVLLDFPEPPALEPNGGDEMTVKVVDMNYQEQTEEWAKAKYSIDWEQADVSAGQKVWRLVELWEKTGHTSHITQTLDEDGNPLPGVTVAFRWSSAEVADIAGPNDYWDNFVYGLTKENGNIGPGMGTGAYRGEGEPCENDGPHQVWVHDDNIKSDLLKCICMLSGTFHDHLDCKFQLVTVGGEPEPPPDTPLKLEQRMEFGHPASMLGIAYPTDVATDTRGDGQGLGIDEDIHPTEWTHPDGREMALVEFCTDFEGDESRAYNLRVYRMSDGATLAGKVAEVFSPLDTPRKRVIYVYVKSEGEEPEPGEAMTIINLIRTKLDRLEAILVEWDTMAEELADLI